MPHPVDQLRDELREHAKEDLDAVREVRARIDTVDTKVTNLAISQAEQTGILKELLRQRDREDTKETAKLTTRSGIWIAALKTLGVIAAAALTGYFTYLASH